VGDLAEATAGSSHPLAALLLVPVLVLLAAAAASLNGALAARGQGAAVSTGAALPLRETARLLRQRRRTTPAADSPLGRTGGGGLVVVALLMTVVVPFGDVVPADLDVGVVWFNAMDVLVWALVWLAGWGPNSAHSLVGGYRFLALALAYELPLMLALTAPAAAAGSLRMTEVVAAQDGLWFVVWMPVAFAVYVVGVAGFSVWGPLSAPAGADVAGGVLVEPGGVDRLLLSAGRYALLAAGSLVAVPLFLGGGAGPVLPDAAWTLLKAAVLLAGLVALRRRLPALRPDRFMEVGWLVMMPAVLLQVLVVAVVVVARG
jgi:NADH-quinone oxidoreductase subunit H